MVGALVCAALLAANAPQDPTGEIAAIEKKAGSRIGLVALDRRSGRTIEHRPNERFRLCSTFKFLAAAAVLQKVDAGKEELDRFISYGPSDLLEYAPVTRAHVSEGGMKLSALCAAALQQSDNTAGNLLLRTLGGPAGLTKFLRTMGDSVSRLDRVEPELNNGGPGDERDPTTPAAMAHDLERLLRSDVLSAASRRQLSTWLAGNTTGAGMIRAGVPRDWQVGDKTGRSGDGAVNDIAILEPPGGQPIFLAIYTEGSATLSSEQRNAAVAELANVVATTFAASP